MMQNLRGKAVRGLAWRGTSTVVQFVISIIVTLILMQFIGPEEYGVVAKIVIVLSLFNILLNLGFSQALVQQEEYSEKNLSSHFVLALILSGLLAIILYSSSDIISEYFLENRMSAPLKWFSFTLIIGGSIIVHRATLHREMKFNKLAFIDIISIFISGVIAIVFAVQGYGFRAVVFHMIANNVIQAILYWTLSSFKPKWHFNRNDVIKTSSFSSFLFLNALVKYFSDLLDQFIISIQFNQTLLGLYNRSVSLVKTPVKLVPASAEAVLFPLFSRLQQEKEKKESIENVYYRTTGIMVLLFYPLLIFFFLFTHQFIDLILGDEWLPIISYLKIMSLTALLYILNFESSLFLSKGKTKEFLFLNIADKTLIILAVLFGIQYGIEGLLWALFISECVIRIIHLFTAKKLFNIDLAKYIRHLVSPFLLIGITVGISSVICYQIQENNLLVILTILGFYVLYLVINYLFKPNQAAVDLNLFVNQIIPKS